MKLIPGTKKGVVYIYIVCTEEEQVLLRQIVESPRFPIARFELRSSRDRALISTALNHVYLQTEQDTMEQVKKRGTILQSLYDKNFINLDYRIFITVKSDYERYEKSDIFALLSRLVEQGKQQPDYLFDIAYIKRGRAVITDLGRQAIK